MGQEKYAAFVRRAKNVLTYDPGWSEDNLTGGWRVMRPVASPKIAPCAHACPAGVDARGYIELILKKDYKGALSLVREAIPFPSVCGRVCNRPCEKECLRGRLEGPVTICHLKRFAADRGWAEAGGPPISARRRKEKIAIVGSGPAGLSAAWELAKAGFAPVVFEVMDRPGGLLEAGIPEFRLPRKVLRREIGWILGHGIDLRLGTMVGRDPDVADLLGAGFHAVFLGIGAQLGKKLGVDGENLAGVRDALEYLKTVNLGGSARLGRRVAVVGGGNAAIDVARTALRSGCGRVTILYRRTIAEMPADPDEVAAALEEGVKIEFLCAPVMLRGVKGRLVEAVCVRMRLGEPDASGRRRPVPIKGEEFDVPVDSLICAVSQQVETGALAASGIAAGNDGIIKVDSQSLETSHPRVFAGGDAVLGPSTVIESITQGKQAARAIMRSLGMDAPEPWKPAAVDFEEINPACVEAAARREIKSIAAADRRRGFMEVRKGFTPAEALAEARRCLHCGKCNGCGICWLYCPDGLVRMDREAEIDLQYCKGCAICVTECPRGALALVREE